MSKLLVALFGLVVLVANAECIFRANTFEGRLRICRRLCMLNPTNIPFRKPSSVQSCTVLLDHGNITLSRCEANCTERRVPLGNTVECQCRQGVCLPPPNPTTIAPAPPATNAPAANAPAANAPAANAPAANAPAANAPAANAPAANAPAANAPAANAPAANAPAANAPAGDTNAPS